MSNCFCFRVFLQNSWWKGTKMWLVLSHFWSNDGHFSLLAFRKKYILCFQSSFITLEQPPLPRIDREYSEWKAQYRPRPKAGKTGEEPAIFQLKAFFSLSTNTQTYQGGRYEPSSHVKLKNSTTTCNSHNTLKQQQQQSLHVVADLVSLPFPVNFVF